MYSYNCGNCPFSQYVDAQLHCFLNPPQVIYDPKDQEFYTTNPAVGEEWWCGQHPDYEPVALKL